MAKLAGSIMCEAFLEFFHDYRSAPCSSDLSSRVDVDFADRRIDDASGLIVRKNAIGDQCIDEFGEHQIEGERSGARLLYLRMFGNPTLEAPKRNEVSRSRGRDGPRCLFNGPHV